jgi:hypothetical protein
MATGWRCCWAVKSRAIWMPNWLRRRRAAGARQLPIGDVTALLRHRPDVRRSGTQPGGGHSACGCGDRGSVSARQPHRLHRLPDRQQRAARHAGSRAWSVTPDGQLDRTRFRFELRRGCSLSKSEAAGALCQLPAGCTAGAGGLRKCLPELRQAAGAAGERHASRRGVAPRRTRLAEIQYREGSTNFLVLLDAQRTLLQAEDAVAQAETGVNTGAVAVYKALGGIDTAGLTAKSVEVRFGPIAAGKVATCVGGGAGMSAARSTDDDAGFGLQACAPATVAGGSATGAASEPPGSGPTPPAAESPSGCAGTQRASRLASARSGEHALHGIASGRVVIELAPQFAPGHVANIKALVRAALFRRPEHPPSAGQLRGAVGRPGRQARYRRGTASHVVPAEFDRRCKRAVAFRATAGRRRLRAAGRLHRQLAGGAQSQDAQEWLTHCYAMVGVGRDTRPTAASGCRSCTSSSAMRRVIWTAT